MTLTSKESLALHPGAVLVASCIGQEARRRLSARYGRVISVYSRAVNVAFPRGLVSIVDERVGRGPLNVTLSGRRSNLPRGVAVGMMVIPSEGNLRFGDELLVKAGDAQTYATPAVFGRTLLEDEQIRDNVTGARRLIMSMGILEGLGALSGTAQPSSVTDDSATSPFVPAARKAVEAFSLGIARGDPQKAVAASQELVGLGIGLTPSGDDLLSGMVLALIHGWRNGLRRCAELGEVTLGIASLAGGRTTILSRNYLEQACAGNANEDVFGFIESVFTGTLGELRMSLERLLTYGATSGTDIATGVALGASMALGEEAMAN